MAEIKIEKSRLTRRIPESLFGFNMEITRSTFWRGLSAQMLNNRKFYAGSSEAPSGWLCRNHRYCQDTEKSLCQSSYVILSENGSIAYTSETVSLKKDACYDVRLWVNGSRELRQIEIKAADNEATLEIPASEEEHVEVALLLKAKSDHPNGVFQITLTKGTELSIFEVSMMPKNNYYGMRKDVIEKLRELKPTHLRFPGGCCTDHFDWKEGLKPAERRKPIDGKAMDFLFPDSFDHDCHDIGINEFLLLCRAVGAEPEYTVRLVRSDAEEARSLVEYCNGDSGTYWGKIRESFGFSPFGIRNWYVGNEIYCWGCGLENNPTEAADKTDAYITAMKSADPTIKTIVGAGSAVEGKEQWSIAYIKAIKSDFDAVSYHRYSRMVMDSEKTDRTLHDKIRTMLQGGEEEGLAFLNRELLNELSGSKHINMDEWNYLWGKKGSTAMLLCNALTMQFILKYFDRYNLSDARFFHPVNEGMLAVTPLHCTVDTSGELFQYYSLHRGGIRLDAVSDSDVLDVMATEHRNNTVCSVINRSDESVRFRLTDRRKASGQVCAGETEYHLFGMKLLSVSETQNDIEKIEAWVTPSDSIEIPANSILFIEL